MAVSVVQCVSLLLVYRVCLLGLDIFLTGVSSGISNAMACRTASAYSLSGAVMAADAWFRAGVAALSSAARLFCAVAYKAKLFIRLEDSHGVCSIDYAKRPQVIYASGECAHVIAHSRSDCFAMLDNNQIHRF